MCILWINFPLGHLNRWHSEFSKPKNWLSFSISDVECSNKVASMCFIVQYLAKINWVSKQNIQTSFCLNPFVDISNRLFLMANCSSHFVWSKIRKNRYTECAMQSNEWKEKSYTIRLNMYLWWSGVNRLSSKQNKPTQRRKMNRKCESRCW